MLSCLTTYRRASARMGSSEPKAIIQTATITMAAKTVCYTLGWYGPGITGTDFGLTCYKWTPHVLEVTPEDRACIVFEGRLSELSFGHKWDCELEGRDPER